MMHMDIQKFPGGIQRLCCGGPPVLAMSVTQSCDLSPEVAGKLVDRAVAGNAFARQQLIEATRTEVQGWVCRCAECGNETAPYAEQFQAVNVWNIHAVN